jgi:hypothetical protein
MSKLILILIVSLLVYYILLRDKRLINFQNVIEVTLVDSKNLVGSKAIIVVNDQNAIKKLGLIINNSSPTFIKLGLDRYVLKFKFKNSTFKELQFNKDCFYYKEKIYRIDNMRSLIDVFYQ